MRRTAKPRPGFSLLELLVTTALMATIVTSASMVLRSTQTAWTMHAADHAKLDAAYATLRHLTRELRQADSIVALSAPGDLSGSISALDADGQTVFWDHSGSDILYGTGAPTSLLASGVTEFSVVGIEADGVTSTTVAADVQSVVCTVKVALDRSSTPTRALSTRIWLRVW